MTNRLYCRTDSSRYLDEDGDEEPWRNEYRRDYARVIHSPSFRRQQGKTQIFPGHESDFFRNRLTHSLEVAQIAESIAHRLNDIDPFLADNAIEPRICFTAALLHDIGHPPFGHNGEEALDECMRKFGGFEGNAQTLRIVTQLEKKRYNSDVESPIKRRAGLNLTYRTLGSVLKYDKIIPEDREGETKVQKGYYACDANIVIDIKKYVCPDIDFDERNFKSIECQIMDIADDIAYSTYDIEDTFKAGFLSPSKILTFDNQVMEDVAKQVSERIGDPEFSASDVTLVFFDLFAEFVQPADYLEGSPTQSSAETAVASLTFQKALDGLAQDGNLRTNFTSFLVGRFISGVNVEIDIACPPLSKITVEPSIFREIEVLKLFTYEATIQSSRVAVSEFRGKDIVRNIFEALDGGKGRLLLPDDFKELYDAAESEPIRKRVICDYIAGMTDRYAMEFWSRLFSDSGETIFKPL